MEPKKYIHWSAMTFKDFVAWCNQRACDGHWGMSTAVACINIMKEVRDQWFWKRTRYWHEKYESDVIEQIVNPINEYFEIEE